MSEQSDPRQAYCHESPGNFITGPSQGLKFWGGQVVLDGDNVSPLVKIGLADLPKSGGHQKVGATDPPAPNLRRACIIG